MTVYSGITGAIKNENDKLRIENNILKQDIGYWKSQHKNIKYLHDKQDER